MGKTMPTPTRHDAVATRSAGAFTDGKSLGKNAQGEPAVASRQQGKGMNEPAMKGTYAHQYPDGPT